MNSNKESDKSATRMLPISAAQISFFDLKKVSKYAVMLIPMSKSRHLIENNLAVIANEYVIIRILWC